MSAGKRRSELASPPATPDDRRAEPLAPRGAPSSPAPRRTSGPKHGPDASALVAGYSSAGDARSALRRWWRDLADGSRTARRDRSRAQRCADATRQHRRRRARAPRGQHAAACGCSTVIDGRAHNICASSRPATRREKRAAAARSTAASARSSHARALDDACSAISPSCESVRPAQGGVGLEPRDVPPQARRTEKARDNCRRRSRSSRRTPSASLFRRGKCHAALNAIDEAKDDFEAVLAADPSNREAPRERLQALKSMRSPRATGLRRSSRDAKFAGFFDKLHATTPPAACAAPAAAPAAAYRRMVAETGGSRSRPASDAAAAADARMPLARASARATTRDDAARAARRAAGSRTPLRPQAGVPRSLR